MSDYDEQREEDRLKARALVKGVKQVGGKHYQSDIDPIAYIKANNLGFLEGNIIKYVTRHKRKGGLEDLRKAEHYLALLIRGLDD